MEHARTNPHSPPNSKVYCPWEVIACLKLVETPVVCVRVCVCVCVCMCVLSNFGCVRAFWRLHERIMNYTSHVRFCVPPPHDEHESAPQSLWSGFMLIASVYQDRSKVPTRSSILLLICRVSSSSCFLLPLLFSSPRHDPPSRL